MVAVLQRVTNASVAVDGKVVGECGHGLMMLLGVDNDDSEKDAELLAAKIVKLRIFSDENGKMNLSLIDVGGEALIISQFTLLANYRHGNRPDFLASAPPERANALYEYFVGLIRNSGVKTETGIFGADMKVSLINDGPVTIVMESSKLKNGEKK